MKKISKILFISVAVILFYSVMFSANAAETIRFNAGNVSTKNNRIFSIPVSGNGNESLSAVKFVFEYDTNAIEFRKINVTHKNSIVKEVEENGELSLIFLNEKGVNLSNSQQLFTVSFKAENMSKNQEINFSVSDCVNSKVQSVNATGGKCIVTYLGNAPDDEDSNGNSSGRTGNTSKTTGKTSSNGNTSNSNSKYEEFENSDEYDDYQEYGDQENINSQNDNDNQYDEDGNILKVNEKDNTLKVFLSGALIVLVLVIIGGVLYHLGRKSKERENKNEKESNNEKEISDQKENNTEQENSNEE